MKFGEAFTEYLDGESERFLGNCSHVEYKRHKGVLKQCRTCNGSSDVGAEMQCRDEDSRLSRLCECKSCPLCDKMFFVELMKEASEIAGYFSSRVRHLLHLHVSNGMQRCILWFCQCFKNNKPTMEQEGQMLIEYITMNAIAIHKILNKYDKVHSSANGKNYKSKLRSEHKELLQLPWLIELGAFSFNLSNGENFNKFSSKFSCNFEATPDAMIMKLPDCMEIKYDLTCAICLETVFNPYALGCGHLFCKGCACSAASVMIFQGLKAASENLRCPICREAGVYSNAVRMLELDLLLKKMRKEYWKQRLTAERSEMGKQAKVYWEIRTNYVLTDIATRGDHSNTHLACYKYNHFGILPSGCSSFTCSLFPCLDNPIQCILKKNKVWRL